MKHIILGAVLLCIGTSAFAEKTAPASKLDSRVRVTTHVDGQVYVVKTALTRATTVEFEQGEKIVSIVAGDTSGFDFESVPGDRVLAVKPLARSVKTNVTVYTNRRSYYLTLEEGRSPFYVLRFDYPKSAEQGAGSPTRKTINARRYGVSASNEVTPTNIWDDGAFTYFQFAPRAPIPAIFKVTSGRERSVNSQVVSDRVVRVSGTSKQWALRLGAIEVCVVETLP